MTGVKTTDDAYQYDLQVCFTTLQKFSTGKKPGSCNKNFTTPVDVNLKQRRPDAIICNKRILAFTMPVIGLHPHTSASFLHQKVLI